MNFDDLQKAWQTQDQTSKITIDADLLLKEIRLNYQQLWRTIFWRDMREVIVGFLMVPIFFWAGYRSHNWTFYVVAAVCLGIGIFMLVYRRLERKNQPAASDPLKTCIESSLRQVDRQIWLLKNVFWWYLLPLAASLEIVFGVAAWDSREHPGPALIGFALQTAVIFVLYWGIYKLNQLAVRKTLLSRREQLMALLAGLE